MCSAKPRAKPRSLRASARWRSSRASRSSRPTPWASRSIGRAGYDPFAAGPLPAVDVGLYRFPLDSAAPTDASLDFLATHPNTPQRIDLAQRHARQFGAPGFGTRDRDFFLAGIDGLLYGDTPEEGYVRGETFLHPGLGVSFSVPQGFIIDNSAAAVTATGPGDMAIRFDGVSIDKNRALTDYIRSGWVAGLDDATVKQETINGNEAATAHAGAEGWQFDIAVIRAGGQVYRLLTAAPSASTSLDDRRTLGQWIVPYPQCRGKSGAEAAAYSRRHRSARPDDGLTFRPDGWRRPQARPVPRAQCDVAGCGGFDR